MAAGAACALLLVAAGGLNESKAAGDIQPVAYTFQVEIPGLTGSFNFTEVSGLGAEIEVIEYRDGTDPIVRKLPGATKYNNITLKRGFTASAELMQWWRDVSEGKVTKRAVALIIMDHNGAEVARYNLFECWPAKWKVTGFTGSSDNLLVEEIELAVERIERG